jgi:hypothetical protein
MINKIFPIFIPLNHKQLNLYILTHPKHLIPDHIYKEDINKYFSLAIR